MGRHRIAATVSAAVALTVGAWSVSAVTDRVPDAGAAPAAARPTPTVPRATVATSTTVVPIVPVTTAVSVGPVDQRAAAADRPSADTMAAAFLTDLNRLRVAEGVGLLESDPGLVAAAAGWASTIAAAGELDHSDLIYDLVSGRWTTAGENVGFGPDEGSVFDGFEASPAHRANMVDPDYTHVGVAVVPVDGALFTVHLFAG